MAQDLRGASRIYYFDNPALTKYRARAQQHLDLIIDDLAESADSTLGMARRKWAPADDVMVDYLVMEGPLVPTIQVRISHVEGEAAVGKEAEEAEYKPYMWVGIAMFNQAQNSNCSDNPNCGFLGSSVEGRLYGLDPVVQDDDADPGSDYDINDSTEFLGGEIYGGAFGQRNRVVAAYGGEPANRLLDWGGTIVLIQPVDQFLIDEGNFQAQNYVQLNRSLVSRTGMISCEGPLAQETAPPEAMTDIDSETYWQRSIVLDPDGFLIGDPDETAVLRGAMCVNRPGEANSDCVNQFNYAVTAPFGGTVPTNIEAGVYEISCFCEAFECECVTGSVHIRLVLGKSSTSLRRIEGEDGSIRYDAGTRGGGRVTVVDIFPETIGSNDEIARFLFRDLMLGGLPPCLDDDRNAFGGNPRSRGWWDQAIRVNVKAGTFEIEPATILKPFFEQGGACGDTVVAGECDPACIGCTGNDPTDAEGVRVPYPAPTCQTIQDPETDALSTIDLMGGVLWHMARVWQVDSQGCICWIKLVGNDGGQGSCSVNPFAYNHTEQAIGTHISGNLFNPGDDPTQLGDGTGQPSCDGGWSVGELVTVIGSTGPCNPCGVGGTRRLVVTQPRTQDNDFTALFWSQLRCGDSQAVQTFWAAARNAMRDFGVHCVSGGTVVPSRTDIEFTPDLAAGDPPEGTLTVTPV